MRFIKQNNKATDIIFTEKEFNILLGNDVTLKNEKFKLKMRSKNSFGIECRYAFTELDNSYIDIKSNQKFNDLVGGYLVKLKYKV